MTTITPDRAADIRWGVCAHLGNRDYANHTPEQIVEMVRYIGASTVRTNLDPRSDAGVAQALALQEAGIALHAPLPCPDNWREPGALTAAAERYLGEMAAKGLRLRSVEFANEMNGKPEGWAEVVRREVPTVADGCEAAGVLLMGPSLIAFRTAQDAPKIRLDAQGDPLASHYPKLAVHSYTSTRTVETAHEERLRILRDNLAPGGMPISMTETGWHTAEGEDGYTPEDQAAALATRLILEKVGRDLEEVFFYQLLDTPGDRRSEQERRFGLFRVDRTPKPIAEALHGLAEVLTDERKAAKTFTPRPLDVTIGGPTTLRSRLLQKSGGSYFLALWLAREGRDLDQPAEIATVTLSAPARTKWWQGLDGASLARARDRDPMTSMTVPIGGAPSILRIQPGR